MPWGNRSARSWRAFPATGILHYSKGVTQRELQIPLAALSGDFPERAAGRIGIGTAPIGVIDPVEGLGLECGFRGMPISVPN